MTQQIITTDLHLTANPDDEYRWGLFQFLATKIRELPIDVKILFILGDLTQDKDNHSAELVNRVVNSLVGLYRGTGLHEIVILRGNHDGLGTVAYFDFLNRFPFIKVITAPTMYRLSLTSKVLLLPHSRNPTSDWATVEFGEVKKAYMHATITGSKSESGYTLQGDGADWLSKLGHLEILSGDVHVPQKIGNVEYVGAPYPIRFGDHFKGRILHLDGKKREEWNYPTIKKAKAVVYPLPQGGHRWENDLNEQLKPDDQLKIEFVLSKEELHEWHKRKKQLEAYCLEMGFKLHGIELRSKPVLKLKGSSEETAQPVISHTQAFNRYLKHTKPSIGTKKVGEEILEKVTGKPKLRLRSE